MIATSEGASAGSLVRAAADLPGGDYVLRIDAERGGCLPPWRLRLETEVLADPASPAESEAPVDPTSPAETEAPVDPASPARRGGPGASDASDDAEVPSFFE